MLILKNVSGPPQDDGGIERWAFKTAIRLCKLVSFRGMDDLRILHKRKFPRVR